MVKKHNSMVLGLAMAFLMCMAVIPIPALAAPSLDWSWHTLGSREYFMEPVANNGDFDLLMEDLVVELTDGGAKTFALPPGTDMTEGVHYRINGILPAGLSLKVTQSTSTRVDIYVRGTASSHTPADNVDGIQLQFLPAAYSDNNNANLDNNTFSNIGIHFLGASVTWMSLGPVFMESSLNDGSINPANYVVITLSNDDQFVEGEFRQDVHFKVHGLPSGLSAQITRQDNNTLRLQLTGNAVQHDPEDTDHFTMEFLDAALVSGDASSISYTMPLAWTVVFTNPSTMTWSGAAFAESTDNDGSVDTVLTVTLGGEDADTFSGTPGVMDAASYTCSNVPAGLDVEVTIINASTAEIRLTGQASAHTAADSVTNMGITFRNAAFTGGDAGDVAGSSRDDLAVTFNDPSAEEEEETPTGVTATFKLGSSTYQVNGINYSMDVSPYATQNRTFVPVRYLGYALGLPESGINWNGSSGQVNLSDGTTNVMLQMGSMWITINGTGQMMDVEPQAQNGRVFLPARWVAEAFGAHVDWLPDTQTAVITR